jgi:hypothetical protein
VHHEWRQQPRDLLHHADASKRVKTSPETEDEKSLLDEAVESVRSAAKGYQKNVSGPLHSFADGAMDKGGTLAAGGGGAALLGGGMVATGIGAAPGALLVAGGGVAATIGGGVAGVGGITETVTTGVDAVAAFVVDGKIPNIVNLATAYAERMVINKVDKLVGLIPGLKGKTKEVVADVEQAIKKRAKKKPAANSDIKKPEPAGDGTKIKGDGKNGGRCKLRPYSVGCPSGTPHHVVPDHCFKNPGTGIRYPGALTHGEGLSICVSGSGKHSTPDGGHTKRGKKPVPQFLSEVAEHGQIHIAMDLAEAALGEVGNPKGTATLGQLELVGATTAGAVTGCDKADLQRQLREYHQSKGLGPNIKLRADPTGAIKNLDPTKMGTSTPGGASGY